MAPRKYLKRKTESCFPNLRRADYRVTSNADGAYNCFAYVVGETSVHWYPTPEEEEGVYWPPGVPRDETIEAFVAAFKTKGYVLSDGNTDPEPGFEKIAIYAGNDNKPCHAAKQLPGGAWTSKLGLMEDIEHASLSALESDNLKKPAYGNIVKILRRRIAKPPK